MYSEFHKGGGIVENAIALGTFDGIHIAHQKVLNLPDRYNKICVTFIKPPKMVFSGNDELIMTFDDKRRVLKNMGFSEVKAFDFSIVKEVTLTEFMEYLHREYNPKYISCGFDYRFGKGGKGDVHILNEFCQENSIELHVCEEMMSEGVTISSTIIREMLKSGEIERANALLQNPFFFTGEVVKGKSIGRTIGFPTINQNYPKELVKVKFGVYKTRVSFDDKVYEGVTNIGVRPTFELDGITSETYIKNFSGDMYGKTVKVELLEFLRPEVKFNSLEELKRQIEIDVVKP